MGSYEGLVWRALPDTADTGQVPEGQVWGREHPLELVSLHQAVVQVVRELRPLVEEVVGLVELQVLGVLEVVDVVVVGEALELPTVPLSPELCTPDPS